MLRVGGRSFLVEVVVFVEYLSFPCWARRVWRLAGDYVVIS